MQISNNSHSHCIKSNILQDNQSTRLVFGASGYVGTNLIAALIEAGIPVRASSRKLQVLEARQWHGVELMQSDALDVDSIYQVCEGIDVAYYLVHSMAAGKHFNELDIQAAKNFALAAAKAGVRQIVYLGGLIPENATGKHLLSRKQTGDVLREGSVPVIELRAGIIVGPGSAAFEVMRDLVFHLPVMLTPRWVMAKSPPIALSNLIEYLIKLPNIQEAKGQIFDAAGPETLSYVAMMKILADTANKGPPRIIPIPFLTPKLSSYWLRFVTSVPTNIAQALIEGLKHDFSADDSALKELIPQTLLNFKESVEAAFDAEKSCNIQSRWVEGAFSMRNARSDYAYYSKKAGGSAVTSASLSSVWQVVTAIGGENRYYYLNALWTIREYMDWCVGGHGRHHGRRHPQEVRVGDSIDSWEVLGVEDERRLTLRFGMKAPGAGILEFELTELTTGETELTATAYWHPAGVLGLAYWYSLVPAHLVIFTGLTSKICDRAEKIQTTKNQE